MKLEGAWNGSINYYTRAQVDTSIEQNYTKLYNAIVAANISSNLYTDLQLTNYKTSTEIDGLLLDVNNSIPDITGLQTKADTATNISTILTQIRDMDKDQNDTIDTKQDTGDYYTGEQVNGTIAILDSDTLYTADEGNLTLIGTVFHLLEIDLAEMDN